MTIIKICGITNIEDARVAVESGADMLGFIFYPRSPRFITPQRAGDIVNEIGALGLEITTVGVFVNETPASILDTLTLAGIHLAQLSGDEPQEHVDALAGRAYKAVRSLATAQPFLEHRHIAPPGNRPLPDLLLDGDHPALYGGSGVRADDVAAATLARECRLLLAGGLTPANVAEVVQRAQPWGVDVASGVEASPGRKDHAIVRAFIRAARGQAERATSE